MLRILTFSQQTGSRRETKPNGGAFHPFRCITHMDKVPKGGEKEDRYSQTTSYKPELASVGQP